MRTERELGDGCSTFAALVVLERLEGHEGAGACDQFVGELCLVVGVLNALVVVLCIAWDVCQYASTYAKALLVVGITEAEHCRCRVWMKVGS